MKNLLVSYLLLLTIVPCNDIKIEYPIPYHNIKNQLNQGWNTWNTRSVTSYVLQPDGLAINLAFKQHYWLNEQYLAEPLIGKPGKRSEKIKPGLHSLNGSYTSLELSWEEIAVKIETAHICEDIVILITPKTSSSSNKNKVIIEAGMLWNRPGKLSKSGDCIKAELQDKNVNIYTTGNHIDDFYVETLTPYFSLYLDSVTGISTGKYRSTEEIKNIVKTNKQNLLNEAESYKELKEPYLAIMAGIAWNTIYEPNEDRVVSTVGRLWNDEYGGYCLFGWDNFFLSYMASMFSRELAFANAIEHLDGATDEGFIPNDNRGNNSKSYDRSQPPVGAIMVKEIYKKYQERWFLESTFDKLLAWNRWWPKKRLNEGLLSYGSHLTQNPFNEPNVNSKITAGYESGMDDSPMYLGIPFNPEKNTLELQDVGLNSLYIADCHALIEIATLLDRTEEAEELHLRAKRFSNNLKKLWDEKTGLYLNFNTDSNKFSNRLSPTLFYPMLARLPDKDKANRMISEHLLNSKEFYGEWILPSIARNDETYEKQRYWKGAIWPPLNFLTYLSLRNYDFIRVQKELSDKSLSLLMNEWLRKGYVSENYSSITGKGDDPLLSSDRFHSWGALFGIISFIEEGYMPAPENPLE